MARRTLGDSTVLTLQMRFLYAVALCKVDSATPDDLREAMTTFEDTARIARRVLGGAHPLTRRLEHNLKEARSTLTRALAKSARGSRTGR